MSGGNRIALSLIALLLSGCATLPRLDMAGRDPLSPAEHQTLGDAYMARGEAQAAAAQYEAVLAQDPKNVAGANNLATALLAEGKDLRRARRLVEKALPRAGDLTPYLVDTLHQIDLREGRVTRLAAQESKK
jgi:Tfp pilus assembly protein PilF